MTATEHDEMPREILDYAYARHTPVLVYCCFSGGHDSLTSTHLGMTWAEARGTEARVLHINTGIGIEATRTFVRETCASFGWPLDEVRALEDCGQDYEHLVLAHGFPGPAQHYMMYRCLKERGVRLAMKRAKRGYKRSRRVMFISGVHKAESQRRAAYDRVESKVDAQIWIAPLYYWSKEQFAAYRRRYNLPHNPVVEMLGMSGECLCGAYAHKGEKDLVRLVCHRTATYLDELEQRVREAGHPWGWEDAPSSYHVRERHGQMRLPLCIGCEK